MTVHRMTPVGGVWADVLAQRGFFTGWYWCDPDGAHVEAAPPAAWPRATHVWAWGPRAWGRWRIDPVGAPGREAAVIGARLDEVDPCDADDSVEVRVQDVTTWPSGEDRAALRETLRDLPVRILGVEYPVQVTFLEVRSG